MSDAGFLRHFHLCNTHDLSKFTPFTIGATQYGWVPKNFAAQLLANMDLFDARGGGLTLASRFDNFTTRSQALATAAKWLAAQQGRDLRDEMYPILAEWGDKPLAQIDRAAVPWFGVRGFGVHVNGYVRKPDGIYLWIGERAHDRQVDPGKLDNLIGGGQPIGYSIEENLCKEAKEEAGIDAALAKTAKRTRDIRYMIERNNGLRNDTLFIFDLEVPDDYTPRNTDGEVAGFHLMPMGEVAEIIRTTDRFKFNCNMVVIDFLMRHGFLTKENPEFSVIAAFLDKAVA